MLVRIVFIVSKLIYRSSNRKSPAESAVLTEIEFQKFGIAAFNMNVIRSSELLGLSFDFALLFLSWEVHRLKRTLQVRKRGINFLTEKFCNYAIYFEISVNGMELHHWRPNRNRKLPMILDRPCFYSGQVGGVTCKLQVAICKFSLDRPNSNSTHSVTFQHTLRL